jgi:hypothetical protein
MGGEDTIALGRGSERRRFPLAMFSVPSVYVLRPLQLWI